MDNSHIEIQTIYQPGLALEGTYQLPILPFSQNLETAKILKKTNMASRALAELKGIARTVPNETILISTLAVQEAKDSSEIENIVTTHDDLYRSDIAAQEFSSSAAKEVYAYSSALLHGFNQLKHTHLLTNATIKEIQAILEGNDAGFRSQSGTTLKNETTGEIVYTPPQDISVIEHYMGNLEAFINDNSCCAWDPLIKMAVIHHQFESIHPFFDGNGRTGRIINVLYLVQQGLLGTPVLYLSRYINQNKSKYYHLLQAVRQNGVWEEWILFMLEGVIQTSYQTIDIIEKMKQLMQAYKQRMRSETNLYSHELLNTLFKYPYTKTEYVEREVDCHRTTAMRYLNELASDKLNLVTKVKGGKSNYYVNHALMAMLSDVGATRLETPE